jgi:hypothetical protein
MVETGTPEMNPRSDLNGEMLQVRLRSEDNILLCSENTQQSA